MNQSESDLPTGLAKPAQRALAGAGYTHLEQLTQASEKELLALHGMGPKAIRLLREALAEKGWSFAEASAS
jgi:predicted flap endonuclease-1-like 5' DNA nuclease